MVLFAALAMARFAEWIPQWTGIDSQWFANIAAFVLAGAASCSRLAWVIERLVLRPAGQPGRRHAADGHAGHRLLHRRPGPDPLRQRHLQDRHRHAEGSDVRSSSRVFQGGMLINKEDLFAAAIAAALVALLSLFFQKTGTGRALRAVADDHQAAQSIGIPLARIWVIVWCVAGFVALVAGMIWGSKLGRAVLARDGGAEGAAGGDPGRPHLGARRHHRRADHRRGREAVGGLPRPATSAAASRSGSPMCWRWCSCCSAAGPVRREDHRSRMKYASTQCVCEASERP